MNTIYIYIERKSAESGQNGSSFRGRVGRSTAPALLFFLLFEGSRALCGGVSYPRTWSAGAPTAAGLARSASVAVRPI